MFGRKKDQTQRPSAQVPVAVLQSSAYVPPSDERKAECPGCHSALSKVPGSKTKCPHCGRYIYVRTDPRINARVVVAETDLEAMDDEIAKANGTWGERLRQKQHVAGVTKRLMKQFGFAPDASDVKWGVFVDDQLAAASRQEWGTLRNLYLQMGDFLLKEKTHDVDALLYFSKVCLMDFVDDRWVLPNTASCIAKSSSTLTAEKVHEIFDAACAQLTVYRPYKRPSETAWAALQKAIKQL